MQRFSSLLRAWAGHPAQAPAHPAVMAATPTLTAALRVEAGSLRAIENISPFERVLLDEFEERECELGTVAAAEKVLRDRGLGPCSAPNLWAWMVGSDEHVPAPRDV